MPNWIKQYNRPTPRPPNPNGTNSIRTTPNRRPPPPARTAIPARTASIPTRPHPSPPAGMLTVQQRTAARLLRRALEAALPPPSNNPTTRRGLVDALVDRVWHALPPWRDATLVLTETEAEQETNSGHHRRRYFDPCIRRFDLYEELFGFRRVVTSPWDKAWRRNPLILHDVYLVHAFNFPPYLESEPYDHVDNITKILTNHPGPVEYLRLDSSVFPPQEMLGRWMDILSTKGVKELVMLDVTAPAAVEAVDFPLERLRSPALARVALGFVRVQFSRCSWFLGLEALTLTCCVCSGRELSTAIHTLPALKDLKVLCGHLAAAGSESVGTVEVQSHSLVSLQMLDCTASALTLRDAPKLCTLVAGVVVGNNGPRRLLIDIARSDSLQEIRSLQLDDHVFFLSASKNSAFYKHRRVLALSNVHTLEVALQMCMFNQSTQLLELIAQLPGLQSLVVKVRYLVAATAVLFSSFAPLLVLYVTSVLFCSVMFCRAED